MKTKKQRTMKRVFDFRQGDVGFVRGLIPATANRIPLRPFALGEVTGHSHRVHPSASDLMEMYEDGDGTIWVRALAAVPIQHEDHDPVGSVSVLPAGWEGEVRIAVEYDEEEDFRPVTD
jgi:hypothetical protein